jgi:hypothetical protein
VSNGYVQWQHVGDSTWVNLISVANLTGPAGANGSNGASVNLRVEGGWVQWQHVGDLTWYNLLEVSTLSGGGVTSTSLFPLGSSAYADGGTGANPDRYIIKNPASDVIGYVNLSWDGSPLVIVGIQATDADANPITHGTWAFTYDGSGNLTSAVCNN